jgi:chitinase
MTNVYNQRSQWSSKEHSVSLKKILVAFICTVLVISSRASFSFKPRVTVVGYFMSWSDRERSHTPEKTQLARVSKLVTQVDIAFIRPDTRYVKGSHSLKGSGLSFPYSGKELLAAIRLLHERNPETKILISVGGVTDFAWRRLDIQKIKAFVKDFELDGVDIDYEPANPQCRFNSNGAVSCQKDDIMIKIIQDFRDAFPRPHYFLSIAAWSIGAFGEGQWRNALPKGAHRGQMINTLEKVGDQIDQVNVMSYDAGKLYNPVEALAAYRYYYKGPIAMGVEVPHEAWGGHVVTLDELRDLAKALKLDAEENNQTSGVMLWSLQKRPRHARRGEPNARTIIQTVLAKMKGQENHEKTNTKSMFVD